ncbi:Uncharacterised protein [Mycobacterium tuberculosis]|uniref:Uncharacterized protein n=1 Tax=Mycobacterium tuberculosis TaxID=1773 RepID=A0A655JCC3_MYCTX|nr:Uncharacterised protein [Mycobacterium tuberculosis]
MPAVTVAPGDDLDVAARPREDGLHHRPCGRRNTQIVNDFPEWHAGPQPFVGPRAHPRRQAELVEPRRRPVRQTDTKNRNQRPGVVDIHRGERDQLRITQRNNTVSGLVGGLTGAGAQRDDAT